MELNRTKIYVRHLRTRDVNGDLIPDSPWRIPLLGDWDMGNLSPRGLKREKFSPNRIRRGRPHVPAPRISLDPN